MAMPLRDRTTIMFSERRKQTNMVQMYLCRLLNDVYSFLLSLNNNKRKKKHCHLNVSKMYFIVFLYAYIERNAINTHRQRIFTFILDSIHCTVTHDVHTNTLCVFIVSDCQRYYLSNESF